MRLPKLSTRAWIAIALYPMVMAVMYGTVAIGVLSFTRSEALITNIMLPGIIVMILLGIPVSWYLAPHLRLRDKRNRNADANGQDRAKRQENLNEISGS